MINARVLPLYIIFIDVFFVGFFCLGLVFCINFIAHIFYVTGAAIIIFVFHVAVLRFPFSLATIEFLIVEIRHQISFDVVDHFIQRSNKTVEIFLVEKYFVALIAIPIFSSGAFRNRNKVVVAPGLFHIQEISAAFAGAYTLGKHALFRLAVATVTTITTVAKATPIPVVAPIALKTPIAVITTVSVSIPKIPVVSPFKMPVFHLSE
jgi:hypothetical protein